MQLRVRISSFIDTTRATALPATRLNRSICGLGAIAFRWWRPRAKSGLLANRFSSERLKEVTVGEGYARCEPGTLPENWQIRKAVPRRSAVESVEMISQSNCREGY